METNQTAVQQSNATDVPKQKTRRRIPKLTAADLAAFPGANPPIEKVVEPPHTYYIAYQVPVTANFGTPDEVGQVLDFAHQLDAQARAKDVGEVASVGVMGGVFVIMLKLSATGEQANPGTPALNAITQLDDFLKNATLLKQGSAGKSVTYKLKVNGTTIGEGVYTPETATRATPVTGS
jgi:hypothetical protein